MDADICSEPNYELPLFPMTNWSFIRHFIQSDFRHRPLRSDQGLLGILLKGGYRLDRGHGGAYLIRPAVGSVQRWVQLGLAGRVSLHQTPQARAHQMLRHVHTCTEQINKHGTDRHSMLPQRPPEVQRHCYTPCTVKYYY